MAMMQVLGIVVPCYNEEGSIDPFFAAIEGVSSELDVDVSLYFVDDGSHDGTVAALRRCCESAPMAHCVVLSRNFGKEAALYAGMERALADGCDYVAVMDVDLQDPPDLLKGMLDTVREGYDCAASYREDRRGESKVRSAFARLFYRIINKVSDVEMKPGARDFRVMTRQMAQVIVDMPERTRFSKGIFSWVGFQTKWIPYENVERRTGSSSWSFFGLVAYALEGVIAFSSFPLLAISVAGFLVFLVACVLFAFILVRALLYGDPVAGWPSLVCLIAFSVASRFSVWALSDCTLAMCLTR